MSLRDTHKYYLALLPNGVVSSSWLRFERQAKERWPTAEKIIECTDLPDDDFDLIVIAHESSAPNAAVKPRRHGD